MTTSGNYQLLITRHCRSNWVIGYRLSVIGYRLLAIGYLLLSACAAPPPQAAKVLPLPTVVPFTPYTNLPSQGQLTLLGYLLIEDDTAQIVPAASVGGSIPQALGDQNTAIWCGTASTLAISGVLATSGNVQHALVLAAGMLDPPGTYGSNGTFTRQLRNPQVTVVAPQEATISDIRTNPGIYQQRIVRVVGWLVLAGDSTVLIDKLAVGGMPAPESVSLKLRNVAEDTVISAGMQSVAGGSVRYGQVQVEGSIIDGALEPITMRLVGR